MHLHVPALSLMVLLQVSSSAFGCQRDNIQVQTDFQLDKYMGKWYEQKWLASSFIPDQMLFQDYTHRYSLHPDRENITIYISGRDPSNLTTCFHYQSRLMVTDTPGKFLFHRLVAGTLITGDYWVVNASYDKYALVFGCREWNEDNVCVEKDSWIWSRIPTLDSVTMAMLETVADNLCINVTNYLSTRQTNECDSNEECAVDAIKPVQNFNIQHYLGRWYEQRWLASSYIAPSELFQDYQHNYILNQDGTITVYISGRDPVDLSTCFYYTATLLTTNTPGKLIYQRLGGGLPVEGSYWVVNTDYNQHALVFGCRETNTTGQCVKRDSWIWSRTPYLSDSILAGTVTTAGNLCINTNNYLATQQDTACPDCFVPVVGMNLKQDMDLHRFLGVWFLRSYYLKRLSKFDVLKDLRQSIVQYPNGTIDIYLSARDPLEPGTCFDQVDQLEITGNAAQFRFTRTERTSIVPMTTDFWVLDTDYDNYAVTYGCRELADKGLCSNTEAWVWVREPEVLSRSNHSKVKTVLQNACLNLADFTEIQHGEDCVTGGAQSMTGHVTLMLCLLTSLILYGVLKCNIQS